MMNNFVVQLYRKELPTALSQQAAAQFPPVSINEELGNVNNGSGQMSEITHCSGQKRVGMEWELVSPVYLCVQIMRAIFCVYSCGSRVPVLVAKRSPGSQYLTAAPVRFTEAIKCREQTATNLS